MTDALLVIIAVLAVISLSDINNLTDTWAKEVVDRFDELRGRKSWQDPPKNSTDPAIWLSRLSVENSGGRRSHQRPSSPRI